jgi:hypothetical protein
VVVFEHVEDVQLYEHSQAGDIVGPRDLNVPIHPQALAEDTSRRVNRDLELSTIMQSQQQQQQHPSKKRKQTGGGGMPVPTSQQMNPGMPGVDPAAMQGMHPALAQQMMLKKMPEPEDPTIGEQSRGHIVRDSG